MLHPPPTRARKPGKKALEAENARLRKAISAARVFCLNPDRINQIRLEEALSAADEWPYPITKETPEAHDDTSI